jgi:hypothetical protein
MTYTYKGPVATAQPSVNPLAALTPGFTRHIFDIFKGGHPKPKAAPDADAPDATPSPQAK